MAGTCLALKVVSPHLQACDAGAVPIYYMYVCDPAPWVAFLAWFISKFSNVASPLVAMDTFTVTPVSVGFAIAVLSVLYLAIFRTNKYSSNKPLKLALIGDLHTSPIDRPLLNWDAWAKEKGPLAAQKLFGIMPFVVINTSEAAAELFSKRSPWYSNRPSSVTMDMVTNSATGQSKFTLMHDYDDHLKFHHRLLLPALTDAPKYQPLMELEVNQLLKDTLVLVSRKDDHTITNKDMFHLIERTQSSIILSLHYGLRCPSLDLPLLQEVVKTQDQITYLAANPGLPEFIPAIRYLPRILSPWKRAADRFYQEQLDLYMRLFNHGKEAPGWNATKQTIELAAKHRHQEGVTDVDLAFTLSTSVAGGMETSLRQMQWLFVAGLLHAGWWQRAQAELDVVVGRGRLPRFADRARLAYTDAVTHELFRWRPVTPGTIPRRAERDDEWRGVRIPRGATLFANAWAIGRDVAAFNPALGDLQDFVPERWLSYPGDTRAPGEAKLRTTLPVPVFGMGRRMCLGKKAAVDGTFMQVTRLLWAFDVEPVEEVDPMSMEVVGFMIMPKQFRFKLKPRGPWVSKVVAEEWKAAGVE
jgi:cytochrome P450